MVKWLCVICIVSSVVLAQNPLPLQTSSLFSGSGNCATCHTGNGTVLSENGVDISPTTHWRSSMMANSSKDPFWRAIVEEEVHEHPQLQSLIENTCTRCHAPAGNRQSIQNGDSSYSMAQMKLDPLANDGVSCTVCHQFKSNNYGTTSSYTGGYNITSERLIYGPYSNPFAPPMITNTNYTPVFTESIHKSEHCATCHTLFTPTIDYNGNIAGVFPEQTPYLEWKNSKYRNEGVECQTCHMPITNTPVDIATAPPFNTTLRTPFWKHLFAGGNKVLNRILNNNINLLGITASNTNFDTTLSYTKNMLETKATDLSLQVTYSQNFLFANITVENLSGHKLPTGIPYRRMWLHLTVKDQTNNVIFESGNWNDQGEIIGIDSPYEPHHNLITDQNQVQIYETILKDVNGSVTKNLLRSAGYLKDNRIPPAGFTSSHPSYDSTSIAGEAALDTNFNWNGVIEGTGSDIVTYKITVPENGQYYVSAELCYQPFSPGLIGYLQGINSPDIQQFMSLYATSDKSPSIMKTISSPWITNTKKEENLVTKFRLFQNYPNPFNAQTKIRYSIPEGINEYVISSIKIYDIRGNEVATLLNERKSPGEYSLLFDAAGLPSGIYYYRLSSGNFFETRKMVLLK
ncbi:MAG TPA: T9SS type A sorting domain-containing protein [Ignavibacteriaceae bacterium]|nr:T9SS type A sorting domain-containing protein [Ignavibacteriaceae bacterium]